MKYDITSWYQSSIKQTSQSQSINLVSGEINTLNWGRGTEHLVILVHGALAHAECWSMIAPHLVNQTNRIIAVDLAGMGNSAWQEHYSIEGHINNICDIIKFHKGYKQVTLVGHSYGGIITAAAHHYLSPIIKTRLILVDVFLDFILHKPKATLNRSAVRRPIRYYSNQSEALKRFRLIPSQPTQHAELFEYLAIHSMVQTEKGWRWKFDPKLYHLIGSTPNLDTTDLVKTMKEHADEIFYIYGELTSPSLIQAAKAFMQTLGQPDHLFSIDQAHHHIMVDNPIQLTATIKHILAR